MNNDYFLRRSRQLKKGYRTPEPKVRLEPDETPLGCQMRRTKRRMHGRNTQIITQSLASRSSVRTESGWSATPPIRLARRV